MSKSDQQQAKKDTKGLQAENTANMDAANTQMQGIIGTAQQNAASLFPGITQSYSDISGSGGYDPSVLGTINDTYSNMATTGGISAADTTSMQNRAAEAAKASYSVGQDAAARSAAATGGYGATGGAIQADLARKGSQAAATAVEDTNASITGMKQQGMAAGAAGLSQVQQNMTGNKLAATAGASNIYGMNENQVSQTIDQILKNYQQTGALNAQDEGMLVNLANQPGVFDKIVSTIGTLGSAAGSIMKPICWIAEAVYGVDDLRTHLLRKYLNTEFKQTLKGKIIMFVYLHIGKFVAYFVKRSKILKSIFKHIFDKALYN